MLCPHCGAETGQARSCPSCGTRIHAEDPAQRGRHVGPGGRHRSIAPIVLAGAAVGLAIVLLVVVVVVLREDRERADSEVTASEGSTPTAAPSPSATSTPSTPGTPTVEPVEQPSATPTTETPDVRTLPAGLFCRDLDAQGYSYAAAVEYWRVHGQPNRMDADSNGIPCETVYPEQDVEAFWSP